MDAPVNHSASRRQAMRLALAASSAWWSCAWAQAPAASAAASAALPPAPAPLPPLSLQTREASAPVDADKASVFFVGTATVILRYAGLTVLTDPNFLHKGEHAHLGYGLTSERLTEPALRLEELPPIDVVVLSHFHGDHFDERVQKGLARGTPILTTPSAVKHLRKLGFTAAQGLQRWQSISVRKGDARMTLTAMPGRHGPAGMARALPPVMGSMLDFEAGGAGVGASGAATGREARGFRLYISGDTLVYKDLEDIPKRYPGVDLALLHLGGTRVAGVLVTMDAAQGVQALRLLDPKKAAPIHYDDYTVFKSPLSDFLAAAEAAGFGDRIVRLDRGQTYTFEARRLKP